MTKTYHVKERMVAARPRSKRLRMLGRTASSSSSPISYTSSSSGTNVPAGRSGMPSSGSSVSVFSTTKSSFPTVGQCYFDLNLGIPLWWNGANWVNSTGARLIACIIDGVESSLLEGSSLEIEVPSGTTVTVTMGGDDITENVLVDGVVTISYIADDIEIMYGDS